MRPGDGRTFEASRGGAGGRRAMTLIEVLVVITIIGLLAGLLIPAVQGAREAARRAQCVANLRQIGIALNSYHADHNRFPPGVRTARTQNLEYQWGDVSPFVSILPYLEQNALFHAMNFDWAGAETAESPVVENRTVRQTKLSVLLCPSDGEAQHRVNYRFNRGRYGVGLGQGGSVHDGPFGPFVVASAATVTDGLSRTAFVSERVAGDFTPGSANPKRNVIYPVNPLPASIDSDAKFIPLCLSAQPFGWEATSGRYWMYSGFANTAYNHSGVPNDSRPSCGTNHVQDAFHAGLHPPRSFHPGGVEVLFGDGHVEHVKNGIDGDLWTRLGTYASGD